MRTTLAVALALAGCVTASDPGPDDEAGGKADGTGTGYVPYIQANTPFYWADSDYAAFTASLTSVGYGAQATPLGASDALTARLQGWVDKIDAIVRDDIRRSGGGDLVAPKPVVEILPSASTFNAWVSPVVACTGIQLATTTPSLPGTVSFLESAYISHGMPYTCVRPTYPDAAAFRTFWAPHKPACQLGADLTIAGTGCERYDQGPPSEVSYLATSPYIHVSTDLIAALDERTVAIVLAHELGHYYRAHVTDATLQRYNFWYETEVDRKKVPVPSTNATELQAKYAEIVSGPRTVEAAVKGHYSARLRNYVLTSIVPILAERTEPDFVCAAARDAAGPWMQSLLDGYGAPSDAITSYLDFETKLTACAPALNLTGDPGAKALSYGTVLMTVPAAKLSSITLPWTATLATVLDALDAKAVKLDQKEAALLALVAQNRIGLYTIEQEADEIALQISASLGISSDEVLESWLTFMAAIVNAVPEAYKVTRQQEYGACRELFAAGFTTKDAAGATLPAFVPIGDLSEPHHSDCYRLFNFWRTAKHRMYTVASPAAFPDDWAALQTAARDLSH